MTENNRLEERSISVERDMSKAGSPGRRRGSMITDLEASELRYRRLFESAKDGILIVDFDSGKILDVNPFLISMLGYSKADFIKKYIWEVGAFRDILASKDKFLELQKKDYVRYEDLPLKTKNGEMRDVEFVSNVYTVNKEKTIQCNIRDITFRKRSEEQLKTAKSIAESTNMKKTDFLLNISHDIRTPISVISGFTDLLLKSPLNEKQKKYCMVIRKKVIEMLDLVGRIIDISVLEKGKGSINKRPFSVRKIMEDIRETCKMQIGNKNIEVEVSIAENIPAILLGDALRIKQILENLCGNAVKYTEKGKVRVNISTDEKKLRRKDHHISFLVEDTGRGIQKEQLLEIFDPYTRFYKSAQKIGGEGLGLHIVKTLVEELGGEIAVSSKEGEGSKFSFTLKMMDAKDFSDFAAEKVNEENNGGKGCLSGIKILVAEDDEDNRELIESVFKNIGCNLQFVFNGQRAVEALEKEKFDLVLMDIRMPVMDGFESAKLIRKDIDKEVPIIALTANWVEGVENKCREAGMNGCISKPLNIATLVKNYQKCFI